MKKMLGSALAAVILIVTLAACSHTVLYENEEYHFRVQFPDSMAVFVPGQVQADDPNLETLELTADLVNSLQQQGGVYYAANKIDDTYREVMVSVQQSDLTASLWWLDGSDRAAVEAWQEEVVSNFQASGVQVLQKGDFERGNATCIFVTMSGAGNGQVDAVYMNTIYNGLQYTILYQADEPVPDLEKEAYRVFYTFEITKTLSPSGEENADNPAARAVLVVVLLLIAVALAVVIVRMVTRRKAAGETGAYTPQFEDTLKTSSKKDPKP